MLKHSLMHLHFGRWIAIALQLWLDIKNGVLALILDDRTIMLVTVLECTSNPEENEFAFGKRFCTAMCDNSIFSPKPVYGYNNWYCDYGVSSAERILQYNDFLYEMTNRLENRPYLVIDAGWGFGDRTKTNAEVIKIFYQAIKEAEGEDCIIIGCNCIGHLGVGLMEVQRIGDDTSGGYCWDRTRKMGVNSLGFRMIQHKTFFEVDADCIEHMDRIPWKQNKKWLDLLSHSGSPLFVSINPDLVTEEIKADLMQAFAVASFQKDSCILIDWLHTTTPERWLINGMEMKYNWYDEKGVRDFGVLI